MGQGAFTATGALWPTSRSLGSHRALPGREKLRLVGYRQTYTMSALMEATVQEFPNFLEGIPVTEQPAIMPELEEMKDAWSAEDGLVPAAALKEIFQISKQAAARIPGKYALTEYEFFDKKWYSMREVKALAKVKRTSGGQGKQIARMVRDVLDDARDN